MNFHLSVAATAIASLCLFGCPPSSIHHNPDTEFDTWNPISPSTDSESPWDWQTDSFCGPNDSFEPNDNARDASGIFCPSQHTGLICGSDVDTFRIDQNSPGAIDATLLFSSNIGDLDMGLFGADGERIATSSGQTNMEFIAIRTAQRPLYLVVYGIEGSGNTYDLILEQTAEMLDTETDDDLDTNTPLTCSVDDSLEPNDSLETAASVSMNSSVSAIRCAGNDDYYKLSLNAGIAFSASIQFDHSQGDLDLAMYNEAGSLLASSQGTSNTETIYRQVTQAGTFFVFVTGASSVSNTYTVTFGTPPLLDTASDSENDTATDTDSTSTP